MRFFNMQMTSTFMLAAIAAIGATGLVAWNSINANVWHHPSTPVTSFYDLEAETLEGESFSFSDGEPLALARSSWGIPEFWEE